MIYHSFQTDYEPKVIGVRDGMSQVEIIPSKFTDAAAFEELDAFLDFRTYWQRTDRTPPRTFIIEYAKLRPRAKLTDFVRFSPFLMGCPFLLSGKAKAVFASHCIPPYYLFDVLIYDKNELISTDYSLFYSPLLNYEAIDFAKSRFRNNLRFPADPKWEYLTFKTQEAFEEYCNTKHRIPEVDSFVMSESFDAKLDFFNYRLGPMFMSERLVEAVKEANLSNAVFPTRTGSLAYAG